jgi:hypothetical protein
MADANGKTNNTNEENVTLVQAEFNSDYRGSFGAFNAGDICRIEQTAFAALSRSDICKAAKTEKAEN